MARKTKAGRSVGSGAFVQLHHFMLDCPAWRSLSPADRAVYLELCRLYNGKNNGALGLGVRRAAELCNVSKNTVPVCFSVLEARGFIERATPGEFLLVGRKQTEWRLTHYPCDVTKALPSKAYIRWKPAENSPSKSETLSQTRDIAVPNEGHSTSKPGRNVSHLGQAA